MTATSNKPKVFWEGSKGQQFSRDAKLSVPLSAPRSICTSTVVSAVGNFTKGMFRHVLSFSTCWFKNFRLNARLELLYLKGGSLILRLSSQITNSTYIFMSANRSKLNTELELVENCPTDIKKKTYFGKGLKFCSMDIWKYGTTLYMVRNSVRHVSRLNNKPRKSKGLP